MRLISISELAGEVSKDRTTVTRWLRDLDYQDGPKGAKLYESDAALVVIHQNILGVDGVTTTPQREKARLDHHRANIEEMKESEKRGELIPVDLVIDRIGTMLVTIKSKLLAVPSKCPVESRQKVKDEIRAGLSELSKSIKCSAAIISGQNDNHNWTTI